MTTKIPKPDLNERAAEIVRKSTGQQEPLPAELEAAWEEWVSHVQHVDERAMTLLRAAFEAGWDAGKTRPLASPNPPRH